MSVVGIDFGAYTSYVAVARDGGIETIANEYSDRCTPSYVSLTEKQRFMGVAAKQQSVSNFKNTISSFKRLIGRRFNDPHVQREKQFVPYCIAEGTNGTTDVMVRYMGEQQRFSPEQILAMLFTKLRETGESNLRTKVVDVVVSVPSFFTDKERRAMLEACQISGLNCMRLMNDTTAVALAYGIYKKDLPEPNDKPRHVVFVDMGYTSLQVSAVAFNKGKLKMLAVSSDPYLGGRDFDRFLIEYFVEDFKKRYHLDVLSKPKALLRLAQECEKLKKLMSANTQAIPINIECFMEDKDVTGKMDRETFENMTTGLVNRAQATMKAILDYTKLRVDDIYAVEIVGGSSRLPCIKAAVQSVFGKEPSTTLNADEAVSRGCALQCAILSPTFRVRDFSILDCQPYSLTLKWQGGIEEDCDLEIFPPFSQIPASKMLTFFKKEPFQLEARYTYPNQLNFPEPLIGHFKIDKVTPQANGESSKLKVKVRTNIHGIFNVSTASMVEKLDDQAEDTAEENMETDDGPKADVSENSLQSEEDSTAESKSTESNDKETPMQTDSSETANEEQTPQENNISEDKKETQATKKKKKTVKMIDLPVDAVVPQLTKTELHLLVEKENQMIMQDKLEKERADSKNAVEEYVYETRDKLYGDFEQYTKESEREQLSKLLTDTEDWLYDEGEDQSKQVYIDKLAQLKKLGQPISERFKEAMGRPAAFEAMGGALQHVRKCLTLIEQKDEKYSHLDESDVEKLQKCLKQKSEWFEKQMNLQGKAAAYENPVVLTSQIYTERQLLDAVCNPILNKPKPKPQPPPEEKKSETKEGTETEGQSQGQGQGQTGEQKPQSPAGQGNEEKGTMDLD